MMKHFRISLINGKDVKRITAKMVANVFEEGLKSFKHSKLKFDVQKLKEEKKK